MTIVLGLMWDRNRQFIDHCSTSQSRMCLPILMENPENIDLYGCSAIQPASIDRKGVPESQIDLQTIKDRKAEQIVYGLTAQQDQQQNHMEAEFSNKT